MNIAKIFYHTWPHIDGYSIRSLYITDSLKQLGCDITAFSSPFHNAHLPPAQPRTKIDIHNDITYYRSEVPAWELIRRIPGVNSYAVTSAIVNKVNEHWRDDYQLIHAYSQFTNGLAGLKIARQHNRPFVYEVRFLWEDIAAQDNWFKEGGLLYNYVRGLETKIFKGADHVTVICEGLKNDLIKRGIPEQKITIVPNGVNTNSFLPQEKNQELIQALSLDGAPVIGYIGTLFPWEGLELLIKAAKLIFNKNKDAKFLIVGDGHQKAKLVNLAKEMDLLNHFIFTGFVPHKDILKYYSIMDVMVYPRFANRVTETVTALKPLEAMALEKTVIASDVGGLKELVADNKTGLLFKKGDFTDLADKCIYALNNPALTEKIRREARRYVIEERNWLKICEKYTKIYRKLGLTIKGA